MFYWPHHAATLWLAQYLPADTVPQVAIGQTVVGGETIIGKLGTQPKTALEFEVRN